ncbi:growth/differentiation factor 9 isoform X2 [Hyla sarda]|uniref:growth/differentiation factor 9 isoform X2 n=1 Tax=Hyla sarda TaxID=327740 RepID=UPI0024C397AD|nr:growth/differentiation factor 9 isoform X2 [Hyla sarda]
MALTLFAAMLYYSTWLLSLSAGDSQLAYESQAFQMLPPLFKELSERPDWIEGTPAPQSVAIKYMKKLFKISATKEGVPRVHRNAEYNTVRLFTPKTECKPGLRLETRGHVKTQDLTFNVDSVSALEQNLRSVLLYAVNKRYSSSNITCTFTLENTDEELPSPMCPRVPHMFEFQLRNKRRWVEIDVTTFLQPFVSTRQIIHLSVNLTCLWNKHHHIFGTMGPLQMTRSPPCLLLYLNDTSNKAYHRRKMHVEPLNWSRENILHDLQDNVPATKVSRHRRGQDVEMTGPTVESSYNFSKLFKEYVYHQNECELHKFRLSFSQLNWDKWILAPHRYSPDYCKGDCPRVVGHKYGSPVHTIVQNIIYEKVDSSIPRPSCVPSEYRPMSVLTIEPDNSIAYKEYEDMIATRCTCR